MNCDLILIANASEARLLARTGDAAELVVLDAVLRSEVHAPSGLEQPAANQSVWADNSLGDSHVPARPLDPFRGRMRRFAAMVACRFEQELSSRHFDRVAVFAACPFLSELMRQLSPATKRSLRAVVDADISDLDPTQTARRSEQELQAGEYANRQREAADRERRLRRFAGAILEEKAAA
ncbi:host attachment protein [Azohydromonas australica]|uniref:host attachment protein n=1 Tax=Azohydromonas australica TaxID=364039 RepID=UPI0003F96D7F|nr:host attachment protein [Azohydromonas australica]